MIHKFGSICDFYSRLRSCKEKIQKAINSALASLPPIGTMIWGKDPLAAPKTQISLIDRTSSVYSFLVS